MIDMDCASCGTPFQTIRTNARYCSTQCGNRERMKMKNYKPNVVVEKNSILLTPQEANYLLDLMGSIPLNTTGQHLVDKVTKSQQ